MAIEVTVGQFIVRGNAKENFIVKKKSAICAGAILTNVFIRDLKRQWVVGWPGTKLFKKIKTRINYEEFQKIVTGFFLSKIASEIQ